MSESRKAVSLSLKGVISFILKPLLPTNKTNSWREKPWLEPWAGCVDSNPSLGKKGDGAGLAGLSLAPGATSWVRSPWGKQHQESAGPNHGYFSTEAPRFSGLLKAHKISSKLPSKFQIGIWTWHRILPAPCFLFLHASFVKNILSPCACEGLTYNQISKHLQRSPLP